MQGAMVCWGDAGCSVGVALGTWSLPFIEAAFGVHGLRFALIWDMADLLAGNPLLADILLALFPSFIVQLLVVVCFPHAAGELVSSSACSISMPGHGPNERLLSLSRGAMCAMACKVKRWTCLCSVWDLLPGHDGRRLSATGTV